MERDILAEVNHPFIVKLHYGTCARSVMPGSGRPRGCSPPGSSVHGSLQARVLEWVAMPFSRGSSPARG